MQRQVLSSSVAAIVSTSIGFACHTGVAATLFARRQTCLPSLRILVWSRPLLSMILFHSIALRPVHYISCCIFVDSEPSFLAFCLSFYIYWLFEFLMSTFIVQHNFDWKPIKWTAFSDSSKMFAMYNCRLIFSRNCIRICRWTCAGTAPDLRPQIYCRSAWACRRRPHPRLTIRAEA